MLLADVSAAVDEIASANPVDGRRIAPSASATAVTSALVASTTIVVRRDRSNGGPDPIVSDAGAGMICGPVTTGRATLVTGDGAVAQAPTESLAVRNSARITRLRPPHTNRPAGTNKSDSGLHTHFPLWQRRARTLSRASTAPEMPRAHRCRDASPPQPWTRPSDS